MTIRNASPLPKDKPAAATFPAFEQWVRSVIFSLGAALAGKTNNIGEVTLTPNSATTTLTDARLTIQSVLHFMPLTATAQAAAVPYSLTADQNSGAWTLNHSNTAATDKTYRYSITG